MEINPTALWWLKLIGEWSFGLVSISELKALFFLTRWCSLTSCKLFSWKLNHCLVTMSTEKNRRFQLGVVTQMPVILDLGGQSRRISKLWKLLTFYRSRRPACLYKYKWDSANKHNCLRENLVVCRALKIYRDVWKLSDSHRSAGVVSQLTIMIQMSILFIKLYLKARQRNGVQRLCAFWSHLN